MNLRKALGLLAASLVACTDSAEHLTDRGFDLIERERWVEAEETFTRALHRDPHHLDAHRGLGWVLLQQGKCKSALDSWRTVVRQAPDEPEGWTNLAYCASEMGELGLAADAYRRSIRLEPRDIESWRSLALVSEEAKDYAGLLSARVKLAELQPDLLGAQLDMAEAYCLYGEFARCEAVARDLITRSARSARAQRILGVALQGQGHINDALRALQATVVMDRTDREAWARLASLYRSLSREAEAQAAEREARR